jgi:acetyltransferase-like isoleucine patch superfamily enzyme
MSKKTGRKNQSMGDLLAKRWVRVWMRLSGQSPVGRIATRLAALATPPHYHRERLAKIFRKGYISADATICHDALELGERVFIDDRCMIFQNKDGGAVRLGDKVRIYRDTIIETGAGAHFSIGDHSSIHPRCQINAYLEPIEIGRQVMIAANSTFYSYDHGMAPDIPIRLQPLQSRGPIIIEDEAWIGTGAIILSGVRIGTGAVIGAGSVVTRDVPPGGIAVGNPARVVKMRADFPPARTDKDASSI